MYDVTGAWKGEVTARQCVLRAAKSFGITRHKRTTATKRAARHKLKKQKSLQSVSVVNTLCGDFWKCCFWFQRHAAVCGRGQGMLLSLTETSVFLVQVCIHTHTHTHTNTHTHTHTYVHTCYVLVNPPIPSSPCKHLVFLRPFFFYFTRQLTHGSPL